MSEIIHFVDITHLKKQSRLELLEVCRVASFLVWKDPRCSIPVISPFSRSYERHRIVIVYYVEYVIILLTMRIIGPDHTRRRRKAICVDTLLIKVYFSGTVCKS